MARKAITRKIDILPAERMYIPANNKNTHDLVCIKLDELEAMRLKDIENLSQEDCAQLMGVSRQTFQNILDSARKGVTQALLENKTLVVRGGNIYTDKCIFVCNQCNTMYEVTCKADQIHCPECNSSDVLHCKNFNKK